MNTKYYGIWQCFLHTFKLTERPTLVSVCVKYLPEHHLLRRQCQDLLPLRLLLQRRHRNFADNCPGGADNAAASVVTLSGNPLDAADAETYGSADGSRRRTHEPAGKSPEIPAWRRHWSRWITPNNNSCSLNNRIAKYLLKKHAVWTGGDNYWFHNLLLYYHGYFHHRDHQHWQKRILMYATNYPVRQI